MKKLILLLVLSLLSFVLFAPHASAASMNVSLVQSTHGTPGSTPIDLTAEGDLDWAVFANSPLTPSTRMSGGTAFTSMTHIGGASESFYNFYAQNNYSWTNGDSPATGSNNLTSNADMGSDGAGVRSTFSIATAGTYRLKFYATTSETNLSATASLASGGVSDTIAGTLDSGLQRYEFTVDFVTDGSDTLTLDVSKSGGSIILAYEAFSLAAVEVVPVPNLNVDSSFSYTNASTAETFQIPYSNNGQLDLTVSGVTVGGSDAAYFTVGSFDSLLAVGAIGNMALNFNPSAGDRVYNATLTIASNDSDSPNTVVNITVNSGNVVSGCVVDIFIVAGQSNANGQGEVSTLSSAQAAAHEVKFFCSWHSEGYNAETQQYFSDWADQTEAGYTRAYTFNNNFGNGGALGGDTDAGAFGPSSWFGPEIGFAARALELNLTGGNQLGIIKYGVDGSGLSTSTEIVAASDWDISAAGYRQGDAWRGFQAAIADAVAKMEADGITPNFKGMIWWQGEGGTSTADLNAFIAAVRSHLGTNYGLEDSADFPVVITTGGKMIGGSTLESGVAGIDDDVTFVNADHYGQLYQTHVGRASEGSADHDGNGTNDMYDIGEAYADALAAIVEPSTLIGDCSGGGGGGGGAEPAPGGGVYVDVFMATGQSNAEYPIDQGDENKYGFGRGAEATLIASGLFSNPTVVKQAAGGNLIGGWYGEWIPGPNIRYREHFFNDSDTGALQAKFAEIVAAGNTPRFRGLFWFQGESDGIGAYATANTPQATYELRWNGLLETLDADLQAAGVDHTQYKFVVNTVAESGNAINNILNYIATSGTYSAKGTIYDAINSPHHGNDDVVDAYEDLHDYDHYAVGQANAQLFIDTFPVGSSADYTITFVNVDGSTTTQGVNEGVTPTPPSPINTATRTFTAWSPSIVPATADATYTAQYDEVPENGEFVDVFIATGQSNAWGPADDGLWYPTGSNGPTYEFGLGVASILENSDKFSNPVVVLEGAPGQPVGQWWLDGYEDGDGNFVEINGANVLYRQQFFDPSNPGSATLEAKFDEIIAAGNTPRFRGLFWFQGENDGGYNGSSTPAEATPDANYKARWNGLLDEIATDVGRSDFNFVMNTVGMVDPAINATFASITTLDSRGVLFDAQVEPYRDFNNGAPNNDVHGYDHFAVGAANAQLFLDTFYSDTVSYTITFVNVDGSTTTQTVNQGVTPTAPAPINTGTRTFTAWSPSIVAATADATYTAQYSEIVDLFIATGQSNAAWPWDSINQVGTFQFGAGVQAALTASGRFSNPTVVSQGEPGMPIDQWWQNGAPQWAYQKNFFGTYQSQTAALEAKIAEIEAAGDTPVFRGVFWFQGEADGQNGTSEADYTERWDSILGQLTSDVGTGDYYFVMNTVGNSGNLINTILTNITNANPRGALFNTQVAPYRTNFADIHGYDHFAVGEANVQLYIDTFVDGTPAPSYTITFVNVDDSVTTQTMFEGEVAIPPAGVDTADRTFTSWPTIAPASADATYTAQYADGNVVSGCVVDLFIVAGQSNANGQGQVSTLSSAQAAAHDVRFFCSWHSEGYNAETQQYFSDWADQTEAGYTRAYTFNNNFGSGGALGGDTDAGALGPSAWFGPEIGFAARALELNLAGGNNPLGIIKYGVDGSGLSTSTEIVAASDWDTSESGFRQGDAWRGFEAAIADAVAKLEADDITPNFKGMIWWQGEGGTSTDDLNAFIAAVRTHLGNNYGLENPGDFPVVITSGSKMIGGSTLESGVAGIDDDVTFVNADNYGQTNQVHVGRESEGSADWTGNGVNDMYDIGEAYADALAAIVEPSTLIGDCSGGSGGGGGGAEPAPGGGYYVDVFMATGQSNAEYPVDQGDANKYGFGRGAEATLVASGLFSNPTVVKQAAPGFPIGGWYGEWIPGANTHYLSQFFNDSGTGALQAKLAEIVAAGDTPRFRGLFWFQGESDGIGAYATSNTSQVTYELRWNGLLETLDADLLAAGVNNTQYKFVVNTVAESGTQINNILNYIATSGTYSAKGTIYDAINSPHHGNDDVVDAYEDLHDYDHYAVGQANAQLFIDTFPVDDGSNEGPYTITFVNVDDSVSTYTADAGVVLTPPTGVNTATRTFTSWPTIAPASADVTYTALYTVDVGSADVTWDGGGADDLWSTPENWSGDTLPANGQTVKITNGDTVDLPANYWDLVGGLTVNVAGNSRIGNTAGGGRLFGPSSTYNFLAGSGLTGEWIYLHQITLNFENGATFDASTVEHREEVTYAITLTGTGFTTLTPGFLRPFGESTWSDVSFDLDVSNYNAADGLVVELIDFSGHDAVFDGTFDASLNPEADALGTLSFDTSTSKVIYTFDSAPTTYKITFVNVDDSQVVQTVAANAVATPPAGVNTETRTFTAWPTVAPATADATYTADYTIDDGSINLGKIICVGDSITEGSATRPAGEGNWSWRYDFWKHLVDNDVNHEFVGTSTYNYDASNETAVSVYPDYNSESFVNRHEAYWGLAAYQVGAMLTGNLATLKDQDETPDTAVVFLGGNDIFQNPSSTAESVRDSIKDIIDKLQGDVGDSGNPNIRILLVSILPRFNLDGGSYTDPIPQNTLFESINALLEPLATEETTGTSEVTYLDLATTFETTANVFYDGIHPNGAGEQLEADAIFAALVGYRITFVNVDGTETTQIVAEGEDPVPPTGVNDGNKIFTGWGTIYAAYEDRTYTANYSTDLSASISVSLSQTANSGVGGTTVNLTDEGDLDWAVFAGDFLTPNVSMSGGSGFNTMSYIGNAVDDESTVFPGQYNFTWSNGDSPTSGSNTLAANATLPGSGDGIRLTFDLSAAGSYQLKFYSTTYDVNLQATASLASAGVSDAITGSYVSAGTEKYEYTIDFTTVGADTLTLDLVKAEGGNFILAYQAFSLASVGDNGGGTTYEITFVNVDGSETTQTVSENDVPTPPTGVNTPSRTFTGWPTIDPATEDATYTALYDTVAPNTVDIYIVAGQSNAYGHALVSDLPVGEGSQDALFYTSWHDTDGNAESTQHFSDLEAQTVAGSSRGDPGSSTLGGSNYFGPEMGFVARANEISLSSNPMAIVKYAVGGTALTQNVAVSDWDLTATAAGDGDCWRGFQTALADAVNKLEAQNYTPNFKGLVWWQGESGTNATDLNAFIAAVRSLLGNTYGVANTSQFPVVITGHDNRWGTDLETGVAALDPYVGFVNSNDYGQVYDEGGVNFNTHPGSADRASFSTDETGNGLNDMWDIGLAYADEMALIVDGGGSGSGPYTITFINVDGSATTYTADSGVVLTPPTGVDTDTRTFTEWPTVTPASADATYTASYTVDVGPYDLLWDGGGVDNSWMTAENWDPDALPATGQTLAIINGDTVDIPANNYELGRSTTINVAGGSQLTNSASAARFHTNMVFNFFAGSGIGGQWLQVENTTFNFEDGATFTAATVQHRFTSTYGITFSSTGFTTLTPGALMSWDADTDWSDVVFNLDVSSYDANNGLVVELMDFSSHDAIYSDNFTPTVNVTAGTSGLTGTLSFDTATSKVIYTFDAVPTTYEITFVNADDSQAVQTVAANAVATPPAGVSTDTRTFTAWPTINPATADVTYTALYDEALSTYTITFINVDGTQTTQTVDQGVVATPPTGVDTDTRTFTAWPTVTPASADATYTALYSVNVGPYDLLWDGGGVDNSWMTAENWDPDALPATGQTLAIINGDTVDIPANNYELGRSTTINVAGGSQLTNSASAARFHTNMVFNFFAGSGIGGQWLQVENTTFNFEDGATFTAATVQHRFTSTYGFTFSSTGFTTLTPGALMSWDADTDWSDVVFNLDFSNYDANNGLVVELMDFSSHDAIYSDNFTPTVNVTAGTSGLTGTLSFDTATSKVIYTFDAVPTTYQITFVNADDSQTVQTVAEGVTPVAPTGVSTETRTFTAWPTINPATADVTYTALYDVVLPTYTITFVNVDDTETTQTVDEGVTPVPPAGVSTDTRTFTAWPTIAPATEDATYTAEYEDVVVPTYTITFINVDDTETTQTVNEDEVATPPAGVDTATRLFKGWPTVAAATADASYTALYDEIPENADIIWDGDAEDGEWTTATNWNTDSLPISTDTVFVGALATVTAATGDFASLEIAEGSSVSFAYEYPGNKTFNVHGVLDRDSPSVLRPGGSVINLSSTGSIGSNMTFLDLGTNTRMSFVDGASFATTTTLELRGATTFDFELSAAGFTALELGNLADGGITGWSELTFNIDVSAYDVSNGINITLMDFASQASVFTGTFNPNVNIIAEDSGIGGALSYNASTYDLILTIDPPGNDAPVASDLSYAFDGTATVDITLTATDIEGDPLTYEVVDGPSSGVLSGTAPNLTYTFSGATPDHDSFTFKANDGELDSNVATVSIVYVPRTAPDLWGWLQDNIENEPLNSATVTTWTEAHSDGSGDTITISRVTYELGELVGTQHTATPVIAAYYARPTGAAEGDNLPAIVQNHGGGQFALSSYAKFWAEQGYAGICINWGSLNLEKRNPNEPASPVDSLHPNTNWDGLPGGFLRPDTAEYPMENPVVNAIFWAAVDPVTFNDGQTLFDIPHPLNSSWVLNGYAARRAITFLQDQPEVDDTKIGVLGWSMGGRTTMMSSTDPRITVLAPAVGGTGYLFEDFWGLPGTARNSDGWQDIELFKGTVADQGYWPYVSAPVMFMNASNDFNAPFDLATKSLSIHEIGLNDVSPTNILVTDPHYNHRVTDPVLASRVLWMRHHLIGDVEFPGISDSELELTTEDGIPLFKVYPDTSTSLPIVSVDIYYGFDRDSRTRFWHDAGAVDMGTHWEAEIPLFDAEDMMVAHAVITYDVGLQQALPFGSTPTTNLFNVASKVHTYYPTGVDDTYSLPADLDTDIHQIHSVDPATLVASGLRETAEISYAIDDPSDSDGLKDWYLINGGNSLLWQYYTRKISDVLYLGGAGAQLTFDLTAEAENTLVVKIVTDGWNENDQTRYLAYVPISAGLNQISLSVSDFKLADNTVLTSWDRVKILGFASEQAFELGGNNWGGALPVLANIVWNGGERYLDGDVPASWLFNNGLPLSNDALLQDSDGDGQRDGDEHKAGTSPVDSADVLKVVSVAPVGADFELDWQAVPGKTYAIEYKANLMDEDWIQLPGTTVAVETTEGVNIVMDPELPAAFFRVIVVE